MSQRFTSQRTLGASPFAALALCAALWLFPAMAQAEAPPVDALFPFTTLRIIEAGEFEVTAVGTAGSGYTLTRRTTSIRAGKGVAFGVDFMLEGGVAGKTVLIEARLFPPRPENGAEEIQAPDRWFIPATIGETVQAAYLPAKDNPPPGAWALELLYGGEKISETLFDLRVEATPEVSGETVQDALETPPLPAESLPAASVPVTEPAPATTTAAPSKAHPRATPTQTVFTVQTGVFSLRENARRQAAALRAQGLASCILKDGEGKGVRYRVLVGRHARKASALKGREKLMAALKINAVVKSFPATRLDKASCR